MSATYSQPQIALLVIDVQRGLFNRTTPIYRGENLLENINELVRRAHQAGATVVIVQHDNDGFLAQGSENWRLHPGLHTTGAEITIHKRHGSAFKDTPLKQELDDMGITCLVVTGLVTHGCVQATCADATRRGFQVRLVKDGHSNYHRQAAKIIETWNGKMAEAGIEVKPTQEIDFG